MMTIPHNTRLIESPITKAPRFSLVRRLYGELSIDTMRVSVGKKTAVRGLGRNEHNKLAHILILFAEFQPLEFFASE